MKLAIYLSIIVCAFVFAPVLQAQEKAEKVEKLDTAELLPEGVSFAELLSGRKIIKGLKLGTPSPNELEGMEFFRAGRLKGLQVGVSTQADVEKIFGASCLDTCRYDDDWDVFIGYYYQQRVSGYKIDSNGSKTMLPRRSLLPEYVGKISLVRFKPRKKMTAEPLVSSDAFSKSPTVSFGHGFDGSASGRLLVTYTDAYGLQYAILEEGYDTGTKDGKSYRAKGELFHIEYRLPQEIEEKLWVEQKEEVK